MAYYCDPFKRKGITFVSVGARLREERMRLGLSQPAFAALAGATKGAQAKWERDDASPNAKALIAWAEAGADALYILTGRRTNAGPNLDVASIEYNLAKVRRDLLDPATRPLPGEGVTDTEQRAIDVLQTILDYREDIGDEQVIAEAESLLEIATDPAKLMAFRAADHAQRRKKRKQIKDTIVSWTELGELLPSESSINLMTSLSLDHDVPLGPLVELMYELLADGTNQRPC